MEVLRDPQWITALSFLQDLAVIPKILWKRHR